MTPSTTKVAVLGLVALALGAVIAFALLGFTESPSKALEAYEQSAKAKDFDAAWARTAQFEGVHEIIINSWKEDLENYIDYLNEGWEFEVWDEKIIGDCAVVIIHDQGDGDKKILDLDPIYLIKQGEAWKLMPEFTDWDIATTHAKDKVDAFKKLDAWYEEREAELKKKKDP